MRIMMFAAVLALSLTACLPEQTKNQIIVDGEAVVKRAPDTVVIVGIISERTDEKIAALTKVADKLATIREAAPNIEGITEYSISAGKAEVHPVYEAGCNEDYRYGRVNPCPITAYSAATRVTFTLMPASMAGPALAAITELGATSASVREYKVADIKVLQTEAMQQAVSDARKKAELIAAASGARVVGPAKLQVGEGFSPDRYFEHVGSVDMDTIVVTGALLSPYSPSVDLSLDAEQTEIKQVVVAAFEIELLEE